MRKRFTLFMNRTTFHPMLPSLKEAYGQYPIPDEIHRLREIGSHYTARGFDMSLIGLRMADAYFPYTITPPDLIPFANTGGDGIHFGFLTDFGHAPDLATAPIVCVTPTNDPPLRLIARNLREFLDLAVSVSHVEYLEQWWMCKDDEAMREEEALFLADIPEEQRRTAQEIRERLMSEFGAKPRAVFPYIREVLRERERGCTVPTLDGLGVAGIDGTPERPYPFDDGRPEDERELRRMREYLSGAGLGGKLAFIRDANYWYVLDRNNPSPVSGLLRELMHSMGVDDEIRRMFDIEC